MSDEQRIIKLDMTKPLDTAENISGAAWSAKRTNKITWLDDRQGHVAAIVSEEIVRSSSHVCSVLTINQSILLGNIHRGIERGLKLRYYPFGTRDADHPLIVSMRAFTYEGGNLYPHDKDVRDAYVWCSGFVEYWLRVDDLIKALDNMQGTHGLDNPMAVIEEEK